MGSLKEWRLLTCLPILPNRAIWCFNSHVENINFFNFFITVDLQYYFVLVSGVQQSGSTIIYTLQSDHPDISRTHLTPYIVITIILTIFPMLYFTSPWLFCNYQFVLLSPCTFSPSPLSPSLWQRSVCSPSLFLQVCFYFVCSFVFFFGVHV